MRGLYGHRSISHFHSLLSNGSLTAESVVSDHLARVDANRHLNAFVHVNAEESLRKAGDIDRRLKDGLPVGRLHGVVIGVKDVISHKDHPLTAGSRILEGFRPRFNATALQRILDEDAIVIGSLNCDEFAMGSSNENSAHGKVLNPLDTERVPGGSSGGSAAAVAAGLCMVSLGSDTGGSVRQPADFCGVIGLKPGYGRISRHGLVAYASSFDQIGILGHNPEDLALLLEIMAGPDGYDATALPEKPPAYSTALDRKKTFRIAYLRQALDHPALDPEISAGLKAKIVELESQGNTVHPVDADFLDVIVPTYYVLTTAEASSNLGRYDGVRFGKRTLKPVEGMEDFYKLSRSEGFGKEVKRRIMLGTFVLSAGYYDAYYGRAQQARQWIREKTELIFNDFDILLLPTSPSTAFRFGEMSQDATSMFLADIFTVYANLAGIPGVSFPIGSHSNGMPFGIQALSGAKDELTLLQFLHSQYP